MSGPSPRRELQGPRPTPLKVRKDSHKIRKPPPPPEHQPYHTHAPPRPPVIIYTVSPKIIHANPNEFMSLVQRLTGPNSSSCTSSSSSSSYVFQESIRSVISPEVCIASIEKTKSPDGRKTKVFHHDMGMVEDIEIGNELNQRTGILSPNPNALPPIPPKFFSPTISTDSNPLSFFHDLSPGLHSNRNYSLENNFIMPSPSFISPHINFMPSPNTLDLLNTLFDL
ncbi:hypothetical protein ACJIZ3_024676 [Penstemon smallii]|uniref:VQ domain-containing protein n=1 Tax=Penstemon smallii TaxID=265156 RepID=A0ABD3TV16_9LAMI